jgi:hypothetical protein
MKAADDFTNVGVIISRLIHTNEEGTVVLKAQGKRFPKQTRLRNGSPPYSYVQSACEMRMDVPSLDENPNKLECSAKVEVTGPSTIASDWLHPNTNAASPGLSVRLSYIAD